MRTNKKTTFLPMHKSMIVLMGFMLFVLPSVAQQSFEPPKIETNTPPSTAYTKRAPMLKKPSAKQTPSASGSRRPSSNAQHSKEQTSIPPTIKRSVNYTYYKADDSSSDLHQLQELNDYLLEIQAVRGNVDAQYLIGERWVFSDSENELAKGLGWLEKAATAEHAGAQALLGYCLYCMDEPLMAGKWYVAAARQGNAIGQYLLGCALANGECGQEQNMSEAASWFALSARQGLPDAQFAVGLHLYYGLGVERNTAWAKKWMQMAAANGYEDARKFMEEHSF